MGNQIALQTNLQIRLQNLQMKNARYSVRAFAKKAGVSAATLSLILNGKRKVSKTLASQLCDRLGFDPQEKSEVMRTFVKGAADSDATLYSQLDQDQFHLFADWRAFAILNLVKTVNFKQDDGWIAKRLGLSLEETQTVLESLLRLKMLELHKGKYRRKQAKYRSTDDLTSRAMQNSHLQTLALAEKALEKYPVQQRDFTWLTFALDPKKIPLAKAMIRKFQDDLLEAMAIDSEPTEVFRMAFQLFPLTQMNLSGENKK